MSSYFLTQKENAFQLGRKAGLGLARNNMPTMGARVRTEGRGWETVGVENIRDVHKHLCFDAELNARYQDPFRATALAFDALDEGGWLLLEDGKPARGPFQTQEEAIARSAGGYLQVVECPSAEDLWDSFDSGVVESVYADLAGFTDADYFNPPGQEKPMEDIEKLEREFMKADKDAKDAIARATVAQQRLVEAYDLLSARRTAALEAKAAARALNASA